MGDLGGGLAIREKAISLVKDAVEKDKAADYASAFKLYMSALDHFTIYLKYEKNPMMQQTIKTKFTEYLERAEELKRLIDGEAATNKANPAQSPDSALRAKPKSGGKGNGADDDETKKMQGALGGAIVTEKPNVSWSDVAGLDAAKDALKEAVILPVKFPQFFTGKRKAWSGFLLYGPPVREELPRESRRPEADSVFSISSSDLVSKWMGESEKLVHQLFSMARAKSEHHLHRRDRRAVRRARRGGERRRAANQNRDPRADARRGLKRRPRAGSRRHEHAVPAGPGGSTAVRQAHLHSVAGRKSARACSRCTSGTRRRLDRRRFNLGAQSEGFSGSDIDHVVKDVLYEPVRKVQEATHFKTVPYEGAETNANDKSKQRYVPCSPGDPAAWASSLEQLADLGYARLVMPPNITANDFRKTLLKARPTVAKADLDVHERFTKEFGEEG